MEELLKNKVIKVKNKKYRVVGGCNFLKNYRILILRKFWFVPIYDDLKYKEMEIYLLLCRNKGDDAKKYLINNAFIKIALIDAYTNDIYIGEHFIEKLSSLIVLKKLLA